jgi:hypothetical protein
MGSFSTYVWNAVTREMHRRWRGELGIPQQYRSVCVMMLLVWEGRSYGGFGEYQYTQETTQNSCISQRPLCVPSQSFAYMMTMLMCIHQCSADPVLLHASVLCDFEEES